MRRARVLVVIAVLLAAGCGGARSSGVTTTTDCAHTAVSALEHGSAVDGCP